MNILLMITEYDYDLKNQEFEKYCRSRFGFCRPTDPKYFKQLCDLTTDKNKFFKSWKVCGQYAHQDMIGKEISNDQLELDWKIFKVTRGKIQDCWEIFIGRRGDGKWLISLKCSGVKDGVPKRLQKDGGFHLDKSQM